VTFNENIPINTSHQRAASQKKETASAAFGGQETAEAVKHGGLTCNAQLKQGVNGIGR
jgi:hypothetical protein